MNGASTLLIQQMEVAGRAPLMMENLANLVNPADSIHGIPPAVANEDQSFLGFDFDVRTE